MAATYRRLVAFALCTVLLAPVIGAQQQTGGIPGVEFIDVNPVLFNADGTSWLELFMGDGLHLRPRAYEEFTRILKPVLTRALNR